MKSQKILGIAASLRNARWGAGNSKLIDQLQQIEKKEDLMAYFARESQIHIEHYVEAGRKDGKNFVEIYENLMKNRGDSGLSNSEVLLAAALWAAHKEGADIDHLSLSEHFTATGQQRNPDGLRAKLLEADGLMIASPVYFGDRSSPVEGLIEFISADRELKLAMRGKVYGGLSVGSKRNGGQETTLIYQLFDMINLGLLGVGNDSDSTAQYGGTGHAGDVGTVHKDSYGIDTSMGTGRRVARVLKQVRSGNRLLDKPKTLFLILNDSDNIGARAVSRLVARFDPDMHSTVVNLTGQQINRCIACDICPSQIGLDEEYRCVIKGTDNLQDLHKKLLYHDLIVPVYVSLHTTTPGSNYQSFIERTRYLRRADYIWNDIIVSPFVLEEPGGYRLIPVRMLTSYVRHQSIMAKPIIGYLQGREISNQQYIEKDFEIALQFAAEMAAGRLALSKDTVALRRYNQIGYVLSADKDVEDEKMQRRREAGEARQARVLIDAQNRLAPLLAGDNSHRRPYRMAKLGKESSSSPVPVVIPDNRHQPETSPGTGALTDKHIHKEKIMK